MIMARPARLSVTPWMKGDRTARRASRVNSAVSMPTGNVSMRTARSPALNTRWSRLGNRHSLEK